MSSQLDTVRAFVATERPARARSAATTAVLAVAGGKGGVGTSTIAALLSATFAAQGRRVLLVDGGRQFAALHALLGVTPEHGLEALHRGRMEPEQLLVPVADGITLLPGELGGSEPPISAAERTALVRRASALFTQYDQVVIDAGATVESVSAALGTGAGQLLAVTAAERIALAATYALVKLVHERVPRVTTALLVNRADAETAERAYDDVREAAVRFLGRALEFAGAVPDDALVTSLLAAGLGAPATAHGSAAGAAVADIAERLAAGAAPAAPIRLSNRRP